jgi:hypothetical protein
MHAADIRHFGRTAGIFVALAVSIWVVLTVRGHLVVTMVFGILYIIVAVLQVRGWSPLLASVGVALMMVMPVWLLAAALLVVDLNSATRYAANPLSLGLFYCNLQFLTARYINRQFARRTLQGPTSTGSDGVAAQRSQAVGQPVRENASPPGQGVKPRQHYDYRDAVRPPREDGDDQ